MQILCGLKIEKQEGDIGDIILLIEFVYVALCIDFGSFNRVDTIVLSYSGF